MDFLTSGNDPLMSALDDIIKVGMGRILELSAKGFATSAAYSMEFFRKAIDNNRIVILTSLGTQTEYGVVLLPNTLTEERVHVALVATAGEMMGQTNYRQLTLRCAEDGTIKVEPGWRL